MNSESAPIPSWDNFNKWWQSQPAQTDLESFRGMFTDHPLFSTAMRMNRSITGVMALHTITYPYWSGNTIELIGWDDIDYLEGGAQFSYTKFHPDDLLSLEFFGELIGNYYVSLPPNVKPHYKAFWDFRFMFELPGSSSSSLNFVSHEVTLGMSLGVFTYHDQEVKTF